MYGIAGYDITNVGYNDRTIGYNGGIGYYRDIGYNRRGYNVCKNGINCKHLKMGLCRFWHPQCEFCIKCTNVNHPDINKRCGYYHSICNRRNCFSKKCTFRHKTAENKVIVDNKILVDDDNNKILVDDDNNKILVDDDNFYCSRRRL